MKTFEIRIKTLREVLEDFSRTYKAIAAGEHVEPVAGVYFASLEAARNLLTPERVKLLALIRHHRPQSIYELARLAGRDLKNVYDDVDLLQRHGILEKRRRKDNEKITFIPYVPYDEIHVNIPLTGVAEPSRVDAYSQEEASAKREEARRRFKPTSVRYLLIAESPPRAEDRFFYFVDVKKADALFLETMKVAYPRDFTSAKEVRQDKRRWLERWQGDGFYLLDAVSTPLGPRSRDEKIKMIRDQLPFLLRTIRNVGQRDARVILISSPVFAACFRPLVDEGFNVVNTGPIDFPTQGRQRHFREKLKAALERAGWNSGTH